ncbi:unnamed protein product (mitochondrion) [Plasmodiophora brassicae]|uniref:Uncharacterized protein n=1 Tax=Plasmodiophora brassicae TaxID=37360 RepID=A0A3P3YKK4_PLABS|nr:unnamed protein product [Plasmodiophora brassicae]
MACIVRNEAMDVRRCRFSATARRGSRSSWRCRGVVRSGQARGHMQRYRANRNSFATACRLAAFETAARGGGLQVPRPPQARETICNPVTSPRVSRLRSGRPVAISRQLLLFWEHWRAAPPPPATVGRQMRQFARGGKTGFRTVNLRAARKSSCRKLAVAATMPVKADPLACERTPESALQAVMRAALVFLTLLVLALAVFSMILFLQHMHAPGKPSAETKHDVVVTANTTAPEEVPAAPSSSSSEVPAQVATPSSAETVQPPPPPQRNGLADRPGTPHRRHRRRAPSSSTDNNRSSDDDDEDVLPSPDSPPPSPQRPRGRSSHRRRDTHGQGNVAGRPSQSR